MPTTFLNPPLPGDAGSVGWSNLHGAAFGLAIAEACIVHEGLLLVVMDDPRQLHLLEREIRFFLGTGDAEVPVIHFPSWECLPYDVFSPHQDIISERLRLLSGMSTMCRGVLLTSSENLMQRLPPVDYVLGHSFSVHVGDRLDMDALRDRLASAHYFSVSQVVSPGEFAVRGGIVDVFPTGSVSPFRIDLLDDEVESIRYFDPDSQRSSGLTGSIELLPAREFPMTDEGIQTFRRAFRRAFEGDPRMQTVYSEVSEGNTPPGIEFYFPLFFDHTATLYDYLPERCLCIHEQGLENAVHTRWAEINDRFSSAGYDPGRKPLPPEMLYLNPDQLRVRHLRYPSVEHYPGNSRQADWSARSLPGKELPVNTRHASPYGIFLDHLETSKDRILIVTETAGRREAMEAMLVNHDHPVSNCTDFMSFLQAADTPCICIADLERGLHLPAMGIQVITENQLYGERVYQRRRRGRNRVQDPASIIRSLSELAEGDPVVHIEHGVGRYRGLRSLDIYGEEAEFLVIEYLNNDRLYVPVLSLNLISRYVGGTPESAPLHRLGSDQWEKAKKRAREKAYDVAAELLEVEAFRQARQGFSMPVDAEDFSAFTGRFPFEETLDQSRAIEEVLADLASPEPMDRLVCGDVGFGKTEVALRAAYVAVQNRKQVAVLVPTTLLAQQHYQTFTDRFADLPVTVELLSRFRGKRELEQIIASMKTGHPDIVIGTHRLLQQDISFRDLGLLIIDEEQRFGVRQKERIKRLRSQVDILTLTATPIPRTLNIALASLRKISIIATPPTSRLSIKTFVREWNRGLIREACLREIRRGGQVYFLHNEVRTMERIVEELKELIPEAAIDFGHGQMGEPKLERVMRDFYHQRFNVLVTSTIIESGIDIPTANTIIINRADRFGLAQLHQLRGRVGRSHHQAFAYLLVPDLKLVTNDARKRLEAIDSMEDLGAGFALASHDLEIRGAGELLGETQSGSIDDVGFNLYSEYLSQAVSSIRERRIPDRMALPESSSTLELHVPALFPESYLGNAHTRLVLYKRIANATSLEELEEIQIETIDRFGLLPDTGKNLFRLTAMRMQAEHIGIHKMDVGTTGGLIEFHEQINVDPSVILSLVHDDPTHLQLGGPGSLRLKGEMEESEIRLKTCERLLDSLAAQI